MLENKCWICEESLDDNRVLVFSLEFDCWYHEKCLPKKFDNLLEYERYKLLIPDESDYKIPTKIEHLSQLRSIAKRARHTKRRCNYE